MRIAIAGYGVEGESSFRYFSKDPNNQITIVNETMPEVPIPVDIESMIGEKVFEKLQGFDLVVRTPGLPPRKIITDGKIWSGTNEFFDKCPGTIIGVTGSKGKGTTASLIASILEEAGKKVWLIGNIGKPALDVLRDVKPEDYVVYELSSFQLWDLEKSPHVAVVLFIEQEHLNVHTDMAEYVAAKANIAKYQSSNDFLVYNKSNKYCNQIAAGSKAKTVGYQDEMSAHVKDDQFYYGEQKICSINTLQLTGIHNLDNACAAIDAIWSIVSDSATIERGLHKFQGLPHRLQFVKEVNRIKYYDDSIATTPGSAIAALRSFDGPKVIILGGSSKGSDFSELAIELTKHDAAAILIGDEANSIGEACLAAGFKNFMIVKNEDMTMELVVNLANGLLADSKIGGTVLLSPASASFGLFKNYVDRGEQYCAAIKAL
jgi:UDP-N-acetylmuramoylalanine--D-glutamate ligase